MALHEGCRRLHKAGKSLGLTGLTLLVLATIGWYLLTETFLQLTPPIVHLLDSFAFYMGWIAAILGCALWIISWICEGFALHASTESDGSR